ncbi:MAG: glycoside hydrolase family 28 protein, partial [Ginsengibacter sp.]
GLPEMNIQDVYLENMVLQAKDGLNCTETTGLYLKNVKLITDNTNPVMNIHNSKNISLDQIGYKDGAELLLSISGEKSSGIQLIHTDETKAKDKVRFYFGATENSLKKK